MHFKLDNLKKDLAGTILGSVKTLKKNICQIEGEQDNYVIHELHFFIKWGLEKYTRSSILYWTMTKLAFKQINKVILDFEIKISK